MNKIGRNSLCPCGSGKKFKSCCGNITQSRIEGLSPSIRMKGGVRYDHKNDGFIAIVHSWDNVDCIGNPKEWQAPKIFQTEESAMIYYQTSIRPRIQDMMTEIQKMESSIKVKQNILD